MRAKAKNFTTFEQWHHQDVAKKLNVRLSETKSQLFREWVEKVSPMLPAQWADFITFCRKDLIRQYESWNETELLAHFIVPFLKTVEWYTDDFNLFHDRPLKAVVKGYPVSGIVDGMVASGTYEPYEPYFFLHEYKKMKGTDADPLGQLLIAMLAARELNRDDQPMYGCYIIGTYWRFVLLEGDMYCQSQGYDASDEGEIQIIWSILHQTKLYVEERVKESLARQNQK
jgi:hypothetical protein